MPVVCGSRLAVDRSVLHGSFKAAVSQGTPESLMREEIDGKHKLYTALATSVPRGEIRLVDGGGHATFHFRRPDAAFQAIEDLLGR